MLVIKYKVKGGGERSDKGGSGATWVGVEVGVVSVFNGDAGSARGFSLSFSSCSRRGDSCVLNAMEFALWETLDANDSRRLRLAWKSEKPCELGQK